MPTVFRVSCKDCDHAPDIAKGQLSGCVITDGHKDGIIIPEGYLEYRPEGGEPITLPHPTEGLALEEAGANWNEASRKGQLFSVTYKVCTDCGTINEEAKVNDNRGGCMIGIGAALITFLFGFYGYGLLISQALLLAYPALMGPLIISFVMYRKRWSAINEQNKCTTCAACGKSDFKTLFGATEQEMKCPQCKNTSMQYTIAGKS